MKKTIIDLWNGAIEPCREPEERTEEVALLVRLLDRHHEHLRNLLSDEGKEVLQKYCDCYDELEYIAKEGAFVKGFSLGVKLVAEGMADVKSDSVNVLKLEK